MYVGDINGFGKLKKPERFSKIFLTAKTATSTKGF
jgi:hypothetical protein